MKLSLICGTMKVVLLLGILCLACQATAEETAPVAAETGDAQSKLALEMIYIHMTWPHFVIAVLTI